jgi:hypothetical protein
MFKEEVNNDTKNDQYLSFVLFEGKTKDREVRYREITYRDIRHLVHDDGTQLCLDEIYFRVRDLAEDENILGTRKYRFLRIFTDNLVKAILLKYREYRSAHDTEPSDNDWKDEILRPLPEVQEALHYLELVGV